MALLSAAVQLRDSRENGTSERIYRNGAFEDAVAVIRAVVVVLKRPPPVQGG